MTRVRVSRRIIAARRTHSIFDTEFDNTRGPLERLVAVSSYQRKHTARGGSVLDKYLATGGHALPKSTQRGEGQSSTNSWLREDTHSLEAHDAGRVSP